MKSKINLKTTKSKIILAVIICLIIIVIYFVGHYTLSIETKETDVEVSTVESLIEKYESRMSDDEKTEAEISENFSLGEYSITDPLIVEDPYNQSPLTAMVCFNTDTETKVSITISGKDELSTFSYDFEEIGTSHMIPVYGLYANMENTVILRTYNSNNELVEENNIYISTDDLPDTILDMQIISTTFDETNYQEGLTFIQISNGLFAIDNNGDIRWYTTETRILRKCV